MDEIFIISGGALPSDFHRILIEAKSATSAKEVPVERWKTALWEASSVEPAMLRAPFVILIFVFLWAANVLIFDRLHLQYHSVLNIRSGPFNFALTIAALFCSLYIATLTTSSRIFECTLETSILLFYIACVVLSLSPCLPSRDSWFSFLRLLKQVCVPSGYVTFPEILLADALTSLSKVFKDIGVTVIAIYARLTDTSLVSYHNSGMMFVALLASIPFMYVQLFLSSFIRGVIVCRIRIRQCWLQLFYAPDAASRFAIILNLIKYATAFPPIWLAALASLGYFHPMLPLITASMATLNSTYSFLWDIIMDWGLFSRRSGLWTIRSFLPSSVHLLAAIVNLLLRFSWTINRLQGFSKLHPAHLVLLIELAEVLRRAIWNIFRVEWEIIVTNDKNLAKIKDEKDEEERESLLYSSNNDSAL